MPKKARGIYTSLCKRGIDLSDLKNGKNPVQDKSPLFLDLALLILLNTGFTRQSLKDSFVANLKWSDGTAQSHVGMVIGLLKPLGLLAEKDGRFTIA